MAVERKLVRSKSGLRIVCTNSNNQSPFDLNEPEWDLDREFECCVKCQAKFDFLKRRHHCRRCGHIFCSECCESKVLLPRMCFLDPVRLCHLCAQVTRVENEFYDRHLKVLLSGANLILSNEPNEENIFFCKLSSDHRFVLFDGGIAAKQEPLPILGIRSAQTLKSSTGLAGLEMLYIDARKEEREARLIVPTNKKASIVWLAALNKAVKMVQENSTTVDRRT